MKGEWSKMSRESTGFCDLGRWDTRTLYYRQLAVQARDSDVSGQAGKKINFSLFLLT